MTARRFEMVEGGSAKFWEVHVEGSSVTVRYGRIGTPGQSKRHDLADPAGAAAEAEKLIKQKTKKGYAEVDAAQAEQGVEPLAASPAAAPASTEPALASAPSAAPAPTPPASGPSPDDLPSTTRRHGRLDWVLAPGGGRDWFALDLGIRTSLAGPWALTLRASGEVVRIDLAACSH
ncbi:MAG: WGR domain-containing protein, partial [Sandaracinus sp.]|nr:WGR domain-containing protein [Sandaracinus sp.]